MKKIRRAVIPVLVGWLAAIAVWIGNPPEAPVGATADAAIVLGAAVDDDVPSPVFRERIAHAIALYREGRVQFLLFTGGKSDGDSLAESEAARVMALAEGVPAEAILIETTSATTMENLVEARTVMAGAGLGSAIIVSDPLHLRRASKMAQSLQMDTVVSATPTTRYRSWRSQVPFLLREVYFIHHFWVFGE